MWLYKVNDDRYFLQMEMDMEMEDDFLNDYTMFCPRCRLALYPTADSKKPFLMSCRVCKYEVIPYYQTYFKIK
jgi:hypothetical protein